MKTYYDRKVDALYIHFQDIKKKPVQTVKLKDFLLIDIGEKGKVCGIEILEASSHLPINDFFQKHGKKSHGKKKS